VTALLQRGLHLLLKSASKVCPVTHRLRTAPTDHCLAVLSKFIVGLDLSETKVRAGWGLGMLAFVSPLCSFGFFPRHQHRYLFRRV
jgi:hypothetical protein